MIYNTKYMYLCMCVYAFLSLNKHTYIYINIYWVLSYAWQLRIFSLLVRFLNLHNLLLCLISVDVIPSYFMEQRKAVKKEFIYFLIKYL